MSIEIYEWPLLRDLHALKTVVFELNLSRWFSSRRDTTWMIHNHLPRRKTATAGDVKQNLLTYDGTRPG